MPHAAKGASSAAQRRSRSPAKPRKSLSTRGPSRHGGYGWIRDLPDARDLLYAAPEPTLRGVLPKKVDLRPHCPSVYDQGQMGSCTANAIAAAIQFDQMKQGSSTFLPSRLFIYYCERQIEGTVGQDGGAQIRDGIKSVAVVGAPPETDWPYRPANLTQTPSAKAYTDAKQDLVASYARVAQVLQQMQGCLAAGYPFVFGFSVYESFESAAVAKSGMMPMPKPQERLFGGHAVLAVGYRDADRTFIVRNSWGAGWGARGYFYMPYEYAISPQLATDFWTVRSVTG